jgi:hypothetical protein
VANLWLPSAPLQPYLRKFNGAHIKTRNAEPKPRGRSTVWLLFLATSICADADVVGNGTFVYCARTGTEIPMFKTMIIATTIAALSLITAMQFADAQTAPKKQTKASTTTGSQMRANNYGKGMQAHWGAGCKMNGSC